MSDEPHAYVSRGGVKLEAALRAFAVDPSGLICTDLGSHVGGFVDCLLRHGAARVYAVDPGYGVLHERLRRDPRVIVCERTNALDFACPECCRLVTLDVGWTPLRLALPAARRCLAAGGLAIPLVKPHYEAPKAWLRRGVLRPEFLDTVLATVRQDVRELGWALDSEIPSPIAGHAGNREFLWRLRAGG